MSQNSPKVTLSLTEEQHATLYLALYPGDGMESVAFLLCGRRAGESRHRLLVKEVLCIPDEAYTERSPVMVTWNTDRMHTMLDKAEEHGLSVVKVHSHPTGFRSFSVTDDISDNKLFPCIRGWVEADIPHASAIMLPSGEMFGRYLWKNDYFLPLERISVIGSDIRIWRAADPSRATHAYAASHAQAFGGGTTAMLANLSVAVVGCSGTGSIVVEQLARLGAGEIVLVDPKNIEKRNINRILNAKQKDIGRLKTAVLAEAIEEIGFETTVRQYPCDLDDKNALRAVAECDIIFGCMDAHRGRHLLNRLASYYTIPYFDLGVRLDAETDENSVGMIKQISGCIEYLIPGMSSLLTRKKISMDRVRSEGLKRSDPKAYEKELSDGYIHGAQESRPAVISVNMFAASLGVNDFLNRIHPYREMPNTEVAEIEFCLSGLEIFTESEADVDYDMGLKRIVGTGDTNPFLGMPGL